MQYTRKPLDIVNNEHGCFFYKMEVDGKCPFDDFCKDVEKVALDKKRLAAIYAMMDSFNPDLKYPAKKFRHIQSNTRGDIYEFKKDNLRVYVLVQKPDIMIVLGGYKANQNKDISKVDRLVIELPQEIRSIQQTTQDTLL